MIPTARSTADTMPESSIAMSSDPPHPVCPQCNYDLSGITPDQNAHITCPECGVHLRPKNPNRVFTKKKLHKHFFKRLLLPTTIPSLVILCLSWISIVSYLVACLMVPLLGIVAFVLWISSSASAIDLAKPHPRPMNLWLIAPLGVAYLLPAVLIFALAF